jgi:hypothetical protein
MAYINLQFTIDSSFFLTCNLYKDINEVRSADSLLDKKTTKNADKHVK